MKLKVTSIFKDKIDHETIYDVDTIIEVQDEARAADLIERGLCKEFKGKNTPAFVLEATGGEDVTTTETSQKGEGDGSKTEGDE